MGCGIRVGQQVLEIRVAGDQHTGFVSRRCHDFLVRCAAQTEISHVDGIVSGGIEQCHECGGEVLVEKKSHAGCRRGSSRTGHRACDPDSS